jgi:MATE family multidrug resistance protein
LHRVRFELQVHKLINLHLWQLGMASALDTLCGQAFGARQYYLLGIYMQRAMFLLTLVSVPVAVIWFHT